MPAGTKWSFDDVRVNLYIPEGTAVHFDKTTENMFRHHSYHNDLNWSWDAEDKEFDDSENREYFWVMTDDGLRRRSEGTNNE